MVVRFLLHNNRKCLLVVWIASYLSIFQLFAYLLDEWLSCKIVDFLKNDVSSWKTIPEYCNFLPTKNLKSTPTVTRRFQLIFF